MEDFVKEQARPEIFTLKPYIAGKPIEEVKRELGIDDIIKLASNENPLGASPQAIQAVKNSVHQMHLYPDSNCYYLKERLASIYDVDITSIIVGNGSDELLKLLAETFLNRGDEIIYAKPSFSEYEFVARIMGAECVEIPLRNFIYDLDAILNSITDKTKMIIICNPNNPTGTMVNASQLDSFMAKVPDKVLVVFDEAYCEFAESKDYISGLKYIKAGRNAVVLRTFSKIYGLASLRVGYGITKPAIAQAVEKVTEPFNVNSLAQVAALAALDDREHYQNTWEGNSRGKKYLYSEFEKMGLNYVPTEASFIFVDTARDCQEVFQSLLQLGIIIRSGSPFGYPTFIRVTVGTQAENKRFIWGLQKVLAL
ncbi:MAG: histidinol-phosphate transaminase [Syntrophomonas sp.]|nr:histidinol-phosphate transaminase [Syntrophomonas sp.]